MVRNSRWLIFPLIQWSCFIFLYAVGGGCAETASSEEKVETVQKESNNSHSSKEPSEWKTVDAAERKSVRTAAIALKPHTSVVEVTGKAQAVRESVLSLGVPGLIKQIPVKLGDKVKKGQVLLKLDQKGFQLSVKQAEAGLAGANAATDQLATEIARVQKLLAENAAPSATLDDLNSQNKGARARVQGAETSLEQAHKALKDSVLRAPYDGVITEILKEEGEQAPTMPATMLMKIVDASSLDVQVFVPEDSSPLIRKGGEATVTVDSANVTVKGEISFVSDVISSGARTFETRVRIDNKDGQIKAGAFARVRFEQDRQDVILIPIASVRRDDDDRPFVFVAEDKTVKRRPVTLGATDNAEVVVTGGLLSGEQLIISDTSGLSDGQSVDVVN